MLRVFFRKVWDAKEGTPLNSPPPWQGPAKPLTATSALLGEEELHKFLRSFCDAPWWTWGHGNHEKGPRMTLPSLEHDTTMDGIFRQRCPPKCCRSTGMTNIQEEATRKLIVRFCNNYGSRQGGKTSAQKGPVGGAGGNMGL